MSDTLHPLGLMGGAPTTKRVRDIGAIIERYFQVSLFLLIVTGFITLLGTNRLDPVSVLFVSVALVLRGYLLLKRRVFNIPEKWATYLTVMYVLIFVVDLFLISGSYVNASVHLVLYSLVVKLFSVQRERDYVYLAVLSFLAVLAASILTVDSLFLGSFFIFILLAVNTFVAMEVRRSLRKAVHSGSPPTLPGGARGLQASLSATGVVIVAGIVIGCGLLFFLLPRFSAGYLGSFAPRNELVTGFGDEVNLGQIGRIQQSNAVVMHVQMPRGLVQDVKWRGVALTVFDGRSWKNEANAQEQLDSIAGRYDLRRVQMQRHNLPVVQGRSGVKVLPYRVVMEPIGTNVLFLASVPVQVAGKFRIIGVDETGSVQNMDHSRMTESYVAESLVPIFTPERLRAQSGVYPPEIAMMYLQLPALDPRVHELALKVAGEQRSDYDKAVAIEEYLRETYGYTLDLGKVSPQDPVAHFLFERKQGHCEYFASSMAVMLRTVGIPARIVNGFRMGEFNDVTGSYIVRARDAHSWVEAYIPSVGWTSFDPTPPGPAVEVTTFSRIRLYVDAAQEFWREWVINYDFGHQRGLAVSTMNTAQRTAWNLRHWIRSNYHDLLKRAEQFNDRVSSQPKRWIAVVLVSLTMLIVLWNLRTIAAGIRHRAIARSPSKSPQRAATIWYARMLKTVARKGYEKPEAQTPSEFAVQIPEASLRDSVSKFTEHYERARFGESAQDAEKLPELFEEIAGRK